METNLKRLVVFLLLVPPAIAAAQQRPLRLWYQQPASQWEGAVPLGNGRLGMTPDGGVARENIVLNDITLWSGSPQDANNYDAYKSLPAIRQFLFEGKNDSAQQLVDQNFICKGPGSGGPQWGCFQTLGNLGLAFSYAGNAAYKNYTRTLSLDSALAVVTYEVNGVHFKKEYFTSFHTDVAIIRITADKPHQVNCTISLDRAENGTTMVKDNTLQLSGQLDNGKDGKGMQYVAQVKAALKDGTQTTTAHSLVVTNATELILYISAGTDFRNTAYEQQTAALLATALRLPYAQEKQLHVLAYRQLFHRVQLSLGTPAKDSLPTDARLQAFQKDPGADNGLPVLFFQFGRYLSISSTRVGLLPPNLQGLWAQQVHTPWNGDYHLDVNVEMNHWPVEVSNLPELNLPLADLVQKMVPHGETTAKAYYNAAGWVAHVITNVWQYTEPGESASWGAAKSGSGWLCDNLWQHYDFTRDTAYLHSIYPVLKGSALFYKSILVRDPKTQWLVTSPSSSPENSFYLPNGKTASICLGPTIDNQIIRELFQNVITAAEVLHLDKALQDTLHYQLTQLPPAGRVAADGSLMEWLEDYRQTDVHHRHVSHLYGLFPANLITPDSTPALAAASKKTLNDRGDDGPSWSIAYKMLWWSRLYDGNRAYKLFVNLMRPTFGTDINYGAGGGIYPNLFSAGPPFQIDANFGGEAGIAEMLLQSHAGYIHLLPAIPDAWKAAGQVKGLKARGNFLVDFSWKEGKITSYKIHSTTPARVKVKVNGVIKEVTASKG
ncbi:alpha-L-fucosidase 2 [Chitinophaga costaii]|uniref:Alpha-L-fucosidase 2 n=1 Tax=Chitinophaga costaii TaxID=1335309 RepID=A0A1C4FLG2_9BACT|nr:glycoside hydrolase family 95 protein [Chitinophaga costaii]PUZ29999.1 glycoside hydrolase family 95 protein [Chitinophaga costaii]SCC56321.1 alpha-L-fucosidase 2 [Chitinophaga costaii]